MDLFVYAPLGFALEARGLLPKFVERGKNQVTMAKMVGQFAVQQGQVEANKRLGPVQEQVIALSRSRSGASPDPAPEDEPEGEGTVRTMADHVDRFAIYKMRLQPLESVKQDPRTHPEGDALYHSLQVFERAREARPYDEEFLLAALLHDIGKAIDPQDRRLAAVEGRAWQKRDPWLLRGPGKNR